MTLSDCSGPSLPTPSTGVQVSGWFLSSSLGLAQLSGRPGSSEGRVWASSPLASACVGPLFSRRVRIGQQEPVTDTVRPRASCSPRPSPGPGGDKSLVLGPRGRNSHTPMIVCLQPCDLPSLPCLARRARPGGASALAQPVLLARGAAVAGAASAIRASVPSGGAEQAFVGGLGDRGRTWGAVWGGPWWARAFLVPSGRHPGSDHQP